MKKTLILFIILAGFIYEIEAQITIKEKSIDSIYYRNNTKWILFTPLFIVKQEFSNDKGNTWEKVGIFGGNVKPYLISDSIATENINLYKYARIAGIAQMWIIAPLLAYKHYTYEPSTVTGDSNYSSTNIGEDLYPREESGYLTASIIVFLTGTFTYHFLSKRFLYRSLHDYNHGILNNENPRTTSLRMDLKIEPRSQIPQLSLVISF